MIAELQEQVEALFRRPERTPEALRLLAAVREGLQDGTIRVAEPRATADKLNPWTVNVWVKQALLLMANLGALYPNAQGDAAGEMDTLPWRTDLPAGCRVPQGSSLRQGSYLEEGVACLPPSVLQIGCHVGSGTAIDSMVSIGIGAQVGKGVQLSCRSTVGGWLTPLTATPTIVEDGAVLGVGSGVYDGAQIGERAVLLAGTHIVPALGVYDMESQSILKANPEAPLRIPPNAVVTSGSRLISGGISIQIPVIVGRRNGDSPAQWQRFTDVHFAAQAS